MNCVASVESEMWKSQCVCDQAATNTSADRYILSSSKWRTRTRAQLTKHALPPGRPMRWVGSLLGKARWRLKCNRVGGRGYVVSG